MELLNISPIDGRYKSKTTNLSNYFSEYAYIKYRLFVEIKYFIWLSKIGIIELSDNDITNCIKLYSDFNLENAKSIKKIESKINHDVKSIEYYFKEHIPSNLTQYSEFIHFGLTSQDINSVANSLSIKEAIKDIILPNLDLILNQLYTNGTQWLDIPMLSRTHGQPASTTLLGKELLVFHERLSNQIQKLKELKYSTKFGGCIGNLNAHYVTYPDTNWINEMNLFTDSLGLKRNQFTTQIDHYDNFSEIFDILRRINVILIDLTTDIWHYISLNYFQQKINRNEVGSSTMPHKINPIDFENSEGNLLLSNTLLQFLANKLPISRLQRDLTDSTIVRNVGSAFGYLLIGYKSLLNGLDKLIVNKSVISNDLNNNWVIVVEAIQTILRKNGIAGYELLKDLVRNNENSNNKTKDMLINFIGDLDIDNDLKHTLLEITPFNYHGKINNNCKMNIVESNIETNDINISTSRLGAWDKFWDIRKSRGNLESCRIMENAIKYLFIPKINTIQDWGCGNCRLKKHVINNNITYIGVDGSNTGFQDEIQDLVTYKTNIDAIYMQHVLEHNQEWVSILKNMLESFIYRGVLVLFTPFTEKTHILTKNTLKSKNKYGKQIIVNDIAFKKEDLTSIFDEYNIKWFLEEGVSSIHNYKLDHIFYLEKSMPQ